MTALKYLWNKHRLLLLGFSLATVLTLVFLAKFIFSVIYWSSHQDVVIETWMPVGYIARSYDVDRDWLMQQTGLPEGGYHPRLSIEDAAREAGVSFEEMRARLLNAIQKPRGQ